MKLSNNAIHNIAIKLLEKKQQKLNSVRLEYQQLATDEYKSQVPKEVVDVAAKYPEYIAKCRSLRLIGHGFNYESVSATEEVIQKKNGHYNDIHLTAKSGDRLFKLKTKIDKQDKVLRELLDETKSALLSLATTKRISENFPEAIPFLPVTENALPVANLTQLRSKINQE